MFKRFLIKILFRLIESGDPIFEVGFLFGKKRKDAEIKKDRWKKALAQMYGNSNFLDYLLYQSESDKERIFRGKSNQDMARGARARTLFIVYSMRMAHLDGLKPQNANEKKDIQKEKLETVRDYKKVVSFNAF